MSVTPWFLVCARRFRQYRHAPRAYSSMLLPPPSFLPTVQTDHFLFSSLHTYISCLHFSGRSPLSGRQTSATEPHPLRPSHALRTRETSRTRQQHAACHASCAHSSHDSGVRPALQHVHQTRRACAHERRAGSVSSTQNAMPAAFTHRMAAAYALLCSTCTRRDERVHTRDEQDASAARSMPCQPRSPIAWQRRTSCAAARARGETSVGTRETSRTRQQHAACHASCAHSSHDSGVRPALQHVHQTRRACAHERHADIICQVGVAIMSGRSARHAYAATHHAATRRTHRHRARAPPWSEAWR